MSYDVQLLFPKDMFKSTARYLNSLPGRASIAGQRTMKIMAGNFKTSVSSGYQNGNFDGLAVGTLQKRQQGKRGGKSPQIRKFGGTKPLIRSGKLARSVAMRSKSDGAKRSDNIVFLMPGLRMSGGGRSDVVGAVNEFGGSWTIVAPPHMRTFLRALALGVAGTDALVSSPGAGSIIIKARIPPRPVWLPIFKFMMAKQPREYAALFTQELRRQTQGVRVNGQQLDIRFV